MTSVGAGCVGSSGPSSQKSITQDSENQNDTTDAVSSSTRSGSTSSGSTPYRTTSIVVAKSGDEAVVTRQVPVAWKKQTEKAERVERLVQRKYGNLDGVRSVVITNAKEMIGELHYSAVEVGVAPEYVEGVDKQIPNRIDGVPINVVTQEHTPVVIGPATAVSSINTSTRNESAGQ